MLSGKANSAPPKGFAQQRGDAGASAQLPPRRSCPWVPRLPPLLAPVRSCTGAQLHKPYFCRSYSSCKEHHKELIMALESGGTWKHTFRAEGSGGSDLSITSLPLRHNCLQLRRFLVQSNFVARHQGPVHGAELRQRGYEWEISLNQLLQYV